MQAIKNKDSKMELLLRKKLSEKGYRYRKNVSHLPGKPDIAFIGKKVVIFLDSCFWHGCRYHCRMPTTNVKYWKEKIARNKKRDKEINREYKKMGWTILRFWEHELKKTSDKVIKKIKAAIKQKL